MIGKWKDANSFYSSPAWRRLRRHKLYLNPFCEICHIVGEVPTSLAREVDHIKPIVEAPDLILSIENLQSLCKSCHSKKTNKENNLSKNLNQPKGKIINKTWDI